MNVGCDPKKHMERLKRLKEKHGNGNGAGLTLGAASALAGWATPTVSDEKMDRRSDKAIEKHMNRPDTDVNLAKQARISGNQLPSFPVATGKRGALNPDLSRWLMGYPEEWGSCGATAMQSCRKLQRRS